MLTTKSAGGLVKGPGPSGKGTMKLKALRGFVLAGESVRPGDIVEVDPSVGRGLVGANKAEVVPETKPAKKGKK